MPLTTVQSAMIGGGSDTAFNPNVAIYENSQTIAASYTITTGNNIARSGGR